MVSKFQDESDKNEIALKPEFCQNDEGIKPFLIRFDSVQKEAEIFAATVENFLKEKKLVIPSDKNETGIRKALINRGIDSIIICSKTGKECNKKNLSMREFY